jgi:ABC-type antimicrobial peptide transport system permease subunit
MLFLQTIRVALMGILANKLRTFLTMLGVVIGVAAIIAMISLGEGAKASVVESISRFGTNLLRVRPGAARLGHIRTGAVETLKMADVEAIAKEVSGIRLLSPAVANMAQVKYLSLNSTTVVTGTTPEFSPINNFPVSTGRFIADEDTKLERRVAAIGTTVRRELFGGGPAIGKEIKIEGQSFTVVGIMAEKGQTSWYDPDDQIFIPITTSQRRVFNQESINDIYVQVEDISQIPSVKAEIERVLRRTHRIKKGVESDFAIRDFTEFVETLKKTTRTFTLLLSGIAAVSLLVGGIGVMNIMLVSVTERTREIGVRMAVGARRSDILRQFLIESVVITLTGGALGIGLGIAMGAVIGRYGEWQIIVRPYSIILGFFFATIVGIVFGVYPARKASLMDPIEALRHE